VSVVGGYGAAIEFEREVLASMAVPSAVSEPPLSTKMPPPPGPRPSGEGAVAELPVTTGLEGKRSIQLDDDATTVLPSAISPG